MKSPLPYLPRRTGFAIAAPAAVFASLFTILIGFSLGATSSPDGQQEEQTGQGKVKALKSDEFSLNVEPILEPRGELAIFRVEVRTLGKRDVFLHYGEEITQVGFPRVEPDGKSFLTQFLLVFVLRQPEVAKKKAQVEFRCAVQGTAGMIVISRTVDASATIAKIVNFPSKQGTGKVGTRQRVGSFLGAPLHVEAE